MQDILVMDVGLNFIHSWNCTCCYGYKCFVYISTLSN